MSRKLKCPACGCEMKEVLIKDRNIKIDICLDGCGGIYFDNRELEQFTNAQKNINEIVELLSGKNFKNIQDTERVCPACNSKMVKNFASPKKAVMIDQCYNCGGVFLDGGELSKIRSEYGSADEMKADVEKMINLNFGEELKNSELSAKEAKEIDTFRELFMFLPSVLFK